MRTITTKHTRNDGSVVDDNADNSVQGSEIYFPRSCVLPRACRSWIQKCRTLLQIIVIVVSIHCLVGCSISVRAALRRVFTSRHDFYCFTKSLINITVNTAAIHLYWPTTAQNGTQMLLEEACNTRMIFVGIDAIRQDTRDSLLICLCNLYLYPVPFLR